MVNLTPWQLLLWIAAVGMIMVPLISILVTTIVTGYFNIREKFYYRLASNFSKAFENALKTMIGEMEKRQKNGTNKTNGSDSNS
jgi:ABC-type Fe3+ transport system permease subunit